MKKLQKAFETSVNICFVSDEKYAKPLCTSLYSLLYNRDKTSLFYKMTFPGRHKNKFMHWEKTSRESASVLLI